MAFPARARQYHRAPSFGKPDQVVVVDDCSLPVMGFENEESRLSCVWYRVAPVLATTVNVTMLPPSRPPFAGLDSVGTGGTPALPFVKYRDDDHCDQPFALPARARQYHLEPLLGRPVHVADVP